MNSTSFTSIASVCASDDNKTPNIDDSSSTTPLTLNFGGQNSAATTPKHEPTCNPLNNFNNNSNDIKIKAPNVNINPNINTTNITNINSNNNGNLDSPTVKMVSPSGAATFVVANKHKSFNKHHPNHSHHQHSHHNNHHHSASNHSSLSGPAQLFESLSRSKSQFGKKRSATVWCTRPSTKSERVLLTAVAIFATTSVVLFVALLSILIPKINKQQQTGGDSRELMSLKDAESMYCLTPDCVKVAASVIEAIDYTVHPCDNFYMYACGSWIKSNPLPEGKPNWGNFGKLWQDNLSIMRSVIENTEFKPGSAEQKAKIYYESCLDKNDTVETRGPKPMQDLIQSTGGWNISGQFDLNNWDLQKALQMYHNQYNRGGLFTWQVGVDERNSSRTIIQLDQGSALGLPSRDFYLNKTDKNVLEAYLPYMIKVAELMGGVNVEQQMNDVLDFERQIAEITVPQDQRRNEESTYHKFTLKEFTNRASFLNWTKYFDEAFDYHSRTSISESSTIRTNATTTTAAATRNGRDVHQIGRKNETTTTNLNEKDEPTTAVKTISSTITKHTITDEDYVVVYTPEYFDAVTKLIEKYMKKERGKVTVANYLGWSAIQTLVATLPKNFRDASKTLRKTLFGSESMEVTWRYCISDTNAVMGFALGALFVRRVFEGESKDRVEEMINSIREAFQDNLDNLNWMDDRTRDLAREKADYIRQMIGFPDFIMNSEKLDSKYEGLELDVQDFFLNNIKVNVLLLRENMDKLNKPPNRTDWEMTPPMVNAYYTPTKNQIVLPAGILQTPFYDLSYPNSLNYGAMGVVLGHELTHAFDDQGREYDKDGNLYKWWNNDTLKNFEDRVKCLVDQYSEYKIEDSHLNGKQTLGENIADNGGLKAAFRAYEKWARQNPSPQLPGLNLTNRQLFFVGFAQVWCSTSTTEALKLQVLNDAHAPAQYRVIGTLSNSHEFAEEFSCPLSSYMNPEKKCVVW